MIGKWMNFVALIGLLFGCGTKGKTANDSKKELKGQIVSYEYVLSGTMSEPIERVHICRDSAGKVVLTLSRPYNNDTTIINVDDTVISKVDQIIRENDFEKLKDSYSNPDVMDGEMWGVYINYTESRMSSHGSNAYPKKIDVNCVNRYLWSLKK